MKKFKITICNVGASPSAIIGMLCDSLEEAQLAFNIITTQTFSTKVHIQLLGDSGELIDEKTAQGYVALP